MIQQQVVICSWLSRVRTQGFTWICGVLVACFCGSSLAAASGPILSMEHLEAAEGGKAEVPVQITRAGGMGALEAEVRFNPAVLEFEAIARGDMLGNAMIDANLISPGRVKLALATLEQVPRDGDLALITFSVIGKEGDQSTLDFSAVRAWELETHQEMLVTSNSGQVGIAGEPINKRTVLLVAIIVGVALLLLCVILLFRRRRKPALQGTQAAQSSSSQRTYCTNCGSQYSLDQKFCTQCGQKA